MKGVGPIYIDSKMFINKAIEIFGDLVFLVSKEGVYLDFKGDESKTLVLPQKFMGKKITEIMPEEIATQQMDAVRKTLETKQVQVMEFELPEENEIQYYEARFAPCAGDKVIVFARNITELRKVEYEKRQEQQKLKYNIKLVENVSDAIISTDLHHNVISWNKAAEKIYGWTAGEIKGRKVSEILKTEFFNETREEVGTILLNKGYWEGEIIQTRKNDVKINIKASVTLFKDESGKPIGVVAVNRDITKLKKVEQQLKESKEKYKTLFEQMNAGFALHKIILDEHEIPIDYRFLEINAAFELLTGLKKIEIIGKKVTEVLPGIEKDPSDWIGKYGNVALTGVPISFESFLEPLKRWYQVSAYSPKKGFFATTFMDISGLKKAEEMIKFNEVRLESLLKLSQMQDISEKEFIDLALEECVKLTKSEGGYLHFIDEDQNSIQLYSWSKEVMRQCHTEINAHYSIDEAGIWADSFRLRIPVIHNEYKYIKNKKGYPEGHFPITRHVSVPVFDGKKVVAIIGVGNKKEHYDASDVKQLMLYMDRTWRMLKQKQSEQKLMESEEKYRILFENNPLGIGIATLEGQPLIMNKAMEDLIGYDSEELKAISLISLYKNPRKRNEFLRELEQKGYVRDYEVILMRKDGSEFIALLNADIIEIKGKKVTQTTLRDITLQKEAEQEIIKERKKAENYLNIAGAIIVTLDEEGNITLLNKKGHQILRHEEGSLIGQNWFETCIPKRRKTATYHVFKRMMNGDIANREYFEDLICTKEGEERRIAWYNVMLEDEEGNIRGTLSSGEDITERKLVERKLRDSEERIQNLINNISDVLVECNLKGVITFLSPQIYDMSGYHPSGLEGKNVLDVVHPDDHTTMKSFLQDLIKVKQAMTIDLRMRHCKGFYIPISLRGNFVEIEGDSKIIGVIRDDSERKRIDEMIRKEIDTLKQLDQIRNDLVRRISHELKTPLIHVFNGVQYLLNYHGDKGDEELVDFLKIIYHGGNRLKNLVDNLLLAYEIESDQVQLKLQGENIISIIKRCVESLIIEAGKRNVYVNLELPDQSFVNVDESKMSLAIFNILSNAIKNTLANGNVFIKMFEHEKHVDVIFEDTGIGITREEVPFLFKRFGKIERFGKGLDIDIEGPGLGLYLSRKIVELHRGTLIVESEGRHEGTTVIMRLPKH